MPHKGYATGYSKNGSSCTHHDILSKEEKDLIRLL